MLAFGGAGQASFAATDRCRTRPIAIPKLTSAVPARCRSQGLVLDGEIVAFDAEGKPDFSKLSSRAQLHRTSEVQRAGAR